MVRKLNERTKDVNKVSKAETKSERSLALASVREAFGDYKAILGEHYCIDDWQAVDIVAASAVAHYIPGEPLWVRVIGGSRSGKTEILSSYTGHADVEKMEVFTPASIRGGLKGATLVVARINGKLVITKDIAALSTAPRDKRTEVLGLLRGLKDGELTADYGSEAGRVEIKGKFDWLIGATPAVERQRAIEGQLGERFIDLRWRGGPRIEAALKAQGNARQMPEIRVEVSKAAHGLLDSAKKAAPILDSDPDDKWIATLADRIAVARTPVARDSYTKNIAYEPMPEAPTSLAQDFSRVAKGLVLLGIENYRPYLERLGQDCLPSIRAKVLGALFASEDGCTTAEVAERLSLPSATAQYALEDLLALGVVARTRGGVWKPMWESFGPKPN